MLVDNVHVAIAALLTFNFIDSVPLTPRALTAIVLLPLLVVLVDVELVVVVLVEVALVVVVLLLPQVKLAEPEPTQCE